MRKMLLFAGLLAASTVQAASLDIDGIGVSREVPCQGQDVDITGNANQIRLTGPCGRVRVHGSQHQVSLDTAAALEVSGIDNQVRAGAVAQLSVQTSGNDIQATLLAAGNTQAAVEVTGANQVLELTFTGPAKVELSGAEHRFTWAGDEPLFEISGVDHRIERR